MNVDSLMIDEISELYKSVRALVGRITQKTLQG